MKIGRAGTHRILDIKNENSKMQRHLRTELGMKTSGSSVAFTLVHGKST